MASQLKGSLEENVLCLLCHSDDHAHTISLRVNPALFSTTAYRKLAQTAFDYLSKFNRPPKIHIRDLVENELRSEHGNLMKLACDAMDAIFPQMQPDFVLSQLDDWISRRTLVQTIKDASDLLQRDDVDGARELLGRLEGPAPLSYGTLLNDPAQALSFLDVDRNENAFPSGIAVLDKLGVMPERDTLNLFLAETNTGKTWYCVHLGKHAIMSQKSVLHISLEMKEQRVARRYVQALFALGKTSAQQLVRVSVFNKDEYGELSSLDYEEITREGISRDNRSTLAKKLGILRHKPKLLIKAFPARGLSVTKLRGFINSLHRSRGFMPDMLIVDQGDNLEIEGKDHRIGTGNVFLGLKSIGSEFDIAVVSPTQGNRLTVGADWVTRKHASEDFSKIMTADNALTYSQTERERKSGLARVLVDKARDNPRGQRVMITQAYDIGQWCLDSVLMSESTHATARSIIGDDHPDPPKRSRLRRRT